MRIVNSQEFYKLPPGTLYCHYEPCSFMELNIKGDTISDGTVDIDYFYQPLIGNVECGESEGMHKILDDSLLNGTAFTLDSESTLRDGMFDDSRMYAVYHKSDVLQLIKQLQSTLKRITSHSHFSR